MDWINPSGATVYQKGIGIVPGYEEQYMVEESGNNYNLIVVNADINDAGRYTCECRTVSSSTLAEIILLGR